MFWEDHPLLHTSRELNRLFQSPEPLAKVR
jgi:hypothetical protein